MNKIIHGHRLRYRWGFIVAIILATIFLPFVVTVYAATGVLAYNHWKKNIQSDEV